MGDNIVVVRGLPITCNPMKVKLRFESECKVCIKNIKIEPEYAKIELSTEEECKRFCKNLPQSLKFGNDTHSLIILDHNSSSTGAIKSGGVASGTQNVFIPEDLSTVQTWSSMKELPSCTRAIIVQPSSVAITIEDIWGYFANNEESHGGLIKMLVPMIDGILVVFKNEEVAENVWNFRPHRIKNKAVMVFPKFVPPCYKNRVVIKVHEGKTDEENLRLLQISSDTIIPPKSVNKCSSGMFLAVYENDFEEQDLHNVREYFSIKHSFDFFNLVMTDCVEMKPTPADISDEEINVLFQNKGRTGGGKVTRIDHSDTSLLVYFASYEDAEAVVQKFAGKTLPVFDVPMKIRLYFHILHRTHTNLDKMNLIDSYYVNFFKKKDERLEKKSTQQKKRLSFNDIDLDVLSFLVEYPEHTKILNSKLQGQAHAEVMQGGIDINLESNSAENQRQVTSIFQHFLKDYSRMRCKVNDEFARNRIQSKISAKSNRVEDLFLRWSPNPRKPELVVAGLKAEVESFVKSLQPFSKQCSLSVEEEEIRWLIEMKVLDQLKKDYPAISGHNESIIQFVGGETDILAAQQAIQTLLKKLKRAKFISEETGFIEFLAEAEKNKKISVNVSALMMRERMHSILAIKHGRPYIVGLVERSDTALALLYSALAVDESIEVAFTKPDTQVPLWETIRTLESEGKIRITMKDSIISIVGFRDSVIEAKEKLSHCEVKFRKILNVERGVFEHIKVFTDFGKICEINLVSYEVTDNGVEIKGIMKAVETVADALEKLCESTTKETLIIEKFGLAKFLKSKDGQDLQTRTHNKHRSTILVCPKPTQKDRDREKKKEKQTLVSEKCSVMFGKLKVSVRQGDITEETNDTIVNSVDPNFDLSHGTVSKAIVEKGGDCIQKELKEKHEKDIRLTSSGKLNCKRIFHVVFPASSEGFIDCFIKLLKLAEYRKCGSISIPGFRAGSSHRDTDTLARLMMRSFRDFVKKNKSIKHLRTVDIIVSDTTQMQDFETELSAATVITSQPLTEFKRYAVTKHVGNQEQRYLKIGNLTVSVKQGDITEERNHAIVNSTGAIFDLSKGMVSKAILKKGGLQIQREVTSAKGKSIRITDAGKLNCVKIMHVVAPAKVAAIKDCLNEILMVADQSFFSTISIPAIGTGTLKLPIGKVAGVMLEAVHEFVQGNPKMICPHKIDFVIFEEQQVKEFQDAMFGNSGEIGPMAQLETDCMEINAYSQEKGRATKALEYFQEEIQDALCSVILDDAINEFTEHDDEFMMECGKKFHVRATRSDGQITIEGMKENRFKAEEDLKNLLKDLALSSPSRAQIHIWEYRDEAGAWRKFDEDICMKIEKKYENFRPNVLGSEFLCLPLTSKMKLINLKTMETDNFTPIRRAPEQSAGMKSRRQLPMINNHFGDAQSSPSAPATSSKK